MKTPASVFYQITQLTTILFYRFRAFVYTAMLCFFLACSSGNQSNSETLSLKNYVKNYCQTYSEAVAKEFLQASLPEVQIKKVEEQFWDNTLNFLENLFQPANSKIDTGFHCEFKVKLKNGNNHEGTVVFLLIENKDFAYYTQWKSIQIVDIGEISLPSGKKYYIVAKYLKIDGRQIN